MNFKILHIKYHSVIAFFIFSFLGTTWSYAQYSIDGPTSAYQNYFGIYTVVDQYGQPLANQYNTYFTWNTTIGIMAGTSGNGMITMPFTFNNIGSGTISVSWFDSSTLQQYNAQILVEVIAAPPFTPSAPTIQSNNCNSTTLKRGTPPTDVTWYWQSTATGTSISDSNTTKTVTSGTIYYLRAKNNTSGVWSVNSSSVEYTIDSLPIWYADTDGDGFGDPASTPILNCTQPNGYVSNNFDECPTQTGNPLNNGCSGAGDSGSTDKNYVHTIVPLIPVSDVSQITYEDDKLESVIYFDGLGRTIQNVNIRVGGQKQDIKIPVIYDEFGRQTKTYLPHATVSNSVLSYTSNTSLINDLNTYYVSKYSSQLNSSNPNAYSETRFDDSPLSRAVERGSPGEDWLINPVSDTDHTTKYNYNSNSTNEVYRIGYTGEDNPLSITSYYAEAALLKNTVKNSNWVTADGQINTKDVFTDKGGKKIAKFSYIMEGANLKTLKTYYIYDNTGNLVYVLTPKIFSSITGTTIMVANLNDLAYQYKYDIYNRQIEQKVPGKKLWEYMVYDGLDRPILTQDEILKDEGKWLFTKYDAFGRTVYSGLYTSALTRGQLQTAVDNYIESSTNNLSNIESRTSSATSIGGVSISYSNNAYPTTNLEVLTVNYYDNYNFTDTDKPATPTEILEQTVTTRINGLPTASWTKTLNASSWAKIYTYYNEKAHIIYIYEKNYLGGYTQNKSRLDFRGKVKGLVTEHKKTSSDTPLVIKDYFTYDHTERPLSHTQSIGGDTNIVDDIIVLDDQSPVSDKTSTHVASGSITMLPGFTALPGFNARIEDSDRELITFNIYDELGQLVNKKIGGEAEQVIANSTGLQTLDYTYDIRGALKKVNDVDNMGSDLFAYELNYESGEGTNFDAPQYNGNISQMVWKSAHNNTKKSYYYDYDDLNRFKKGRYGEGSNLTSSSGNFEVSVNGYDYNGNITGVTRNGGSTGSSIDNLTYYYDSGNQLMKVTDASGTPGFKNGTNSGDDYTYDDNGNLIEDLNKGISLIEYNHLDLVTKVTFTDGKRIEFDYDAAGVKLQMRYVNGGITTTTDYIGGFQSQNNTLQFFPTSEGYVSPEVVSGSIEYNYVYTLRDHLGNNRIAFKDIGNDGNIDSSDMLSSTDYYPMGMTHYGEYITNSNYNYKYQGKEKLLANGYNMYNFGSRMYDASVGRWFNIDPQNQFSSPYLAMGNNWGASVDPDGEFVIPALIGAGVGIIMNGLNNDMQGQPFFNGALKAGTIGALGGIASHGIGEAATAFAEVGWSQLAVGSFQAGAHALSGGITSELSGGKFLHGAISGIFSSAVGSTVSYYGGSTGSKIIFGSLAGGLSSKAFGGSFLQGFSQGLVSSTLNHGAHEIEYMVTKARLITALKKAGICTVCTHKEVGDAFELITSLRYGEAGIALFPGVPLQSIFGNTIPDFYHTLEGNITGTPYAMGALVEVKAKNSGSYLGLFSQNGQIFKQIFIHSQLLWKAGYISGRGSHTLVTTAGVIVSPSIRYFAQRLGIQSSHYYSVYTGRLSIGNINFKKSY